MDHEQKVNQDTKPMHQDTVILSEEQEEVGLFCFYEGHVVLLAGE